MAKQRLLYVVGARPNFVKMAPIVAELKRRLPDADHIVDHTGQHYERFVERLQIVDDGTGRPR